MNLTPFRERQPGPWSGIGTVALYFLLQFALGIIVAVIVGIALGVQVGISALALHRGFDPGSIVRAMRTNPDLRVTVAVLAIVGAAATTALIVRRVWPALWSRGDLPGFGLVRPASTWAWPGAVFLGVLLLGLGGYLTQHLAGSHPVHQDVVVMAGRVSPGMKALLALMAVGVAPFAEELVFRGVLLSGLARRMHVGWAVIVSAVLFGCAHLPDFGFAWYPVPELVLLGLVLGWLRLAARSLWPCITMHATFNLIAVLAWFLVVRQP